MKAKIFFCGLTCMDELFTTKIAMCVNKINIVLFDFTRTLRLLTTEWHNPDVITKHFMEKK